VGSEHFAARLRELREAAGLGRQELADKAGMKIGGIRDLEQGLRRPLWDTVVALAEALGADIRAFLEEPAEPPEKRGRGRPPKAPAEPPAEPEPKRPRGRPRKGKTV
jgi:transcriptional regulator with XRE-family HTH domain